MIKTIILCCTAFLLVFPAVSAQLCDSIIVAGRILNIPDGGSRTVIINECDISDKSERRVAEIDSLGRFCERIPFYGGHTFTLNYSRQLFINAYAEPGDSINVEIDASKLPFEFRVSGSHAELNNQYSHASAQLASVYYGNIKLLSDTTPLAEYMARFKAEIGRIGVSVNEYIRENKVNEETAELLRLDNIFAIANHAIGYRGRNRDEQLAFFTDSIFDIENSSNARIMLFPYHLSALCFEFPDYVDRMPKGRVKDLMYASMRNDVIPDRDTFSDTAYYDRLFGKSPKEIKLDKAGTSDIVVFDGDSLHNVDNENFMKWLQRSYPGRPIYLDVSATWCGPCRAALAASEGIRGHFRGSDVVFAIIWLWSDMESWSKLVPEITNAIHLFVADDDTANRIIDAFGVNGFPSYYFIDRDGNIVSEGVPHYNSAGLPDFIKSHS